MALQVWLPLDNNIKNLGLKNVTCTKLGTVNFEDGKIGKAFSRGSTQITDGVRLNTNFLDMFNGSKKCSVAVWVKPAGNHVHYNGTILSSGNWNSKKWAFGLSQDNSKVDVFCNSYNTYVNCAVPVGEWTHLVSVYDNRSCKLYKNGVYVASYTTSSDFDSDAQITCVGRETYANGYFGFYGLINDLRIYDHCLSPKEIKEISQGLTVHFPLDFNEYKLTSCTNLVKNGWRGTDNWIASVFTNDLPNIVGVTQRYTYNTTKEYIELNHDHEYQYSAYIKKLPNSTVTRCFTALDTWDSDGLHIGYINEPEAFRSGTQTTLAQDLNPGDTLVYLTSTTNWQANYYVAIFGYTNSEGYTYPDYTYTRYVYKYTTIDTVNKTVTLSAAYSGDVVSAGTAVCQTTPGSTYYYPNSIESSTVEDWTLLSKNFIPKNVNRLKYAKYIKPQGMGGYNYTAGCTLIDLTEGTTVYDSSGFCNNGTISGNMQIDPKSPRYETCMQTLTDNSYISFPTRKFQEFTYSFWVKRDRVSQTNREMIMTGWYGLSFELNPNNTLSFIRSISNTSNFIVTSNTLLNDTSKWYHVVLTKDSSGVSNIYINGVLDKSGTNENNVYYSNDTTKIGIYNSATYQFLGSISDFRIYATALSENEIKELYDTSTIIDNKGTLHTFEILENSENLLKYENCLKYTNPANTETRGKIVMRNGTPAMAFQPTDTYFGTANDRGKLLYGFFKENTQYLFDLWLDNDEAVDNSGNAYWTGFKVIYTDGTENSYETQAKGANTGSTPIGFQHKVFISPPNKSIKSLRIKYNYNKLQYVRADSTITEVSNTKISKTGIVDTGQFIEGTEGSLDAQAIIYRGGMESNSITEI